MVIRDFHELLCGPGCSAEGAVPAMVEPKIPVTCDVQKAAAIYGVSNDFELEES